MENGKIIIQKPLYGIRMKSSRNKERRASRKSGMYLYRYLQENQPFVFEIVSENDALLQKIKDILHNRTFFIGKSKSSEFGGAPEITFQGEEGMTFPCQIQTLYAESRLSFLNEYGDFTTSLTAEMLTGNPKARIDWEKSRIVFRSYMPYNQHRKNWDAERLIVEKGSVIVLKEPVNVKPEIFLKGIGAYITEGFGRILPDPDFLKNNRYEYEKISADTEPTPVKPQETPELILTLQKRNKLTQQIIEIQDKVDNFINNNTFSPKITASQWSRIYIAAKTSNNLDELKQKLEEIFKPKHREIWSKSEINQLKKFLSEHENKNPLYALKLLAKKMRDYLKNKENFKTKSL